jgi:competence protein ComEC
VRVVDPRYALSLLALAACENPPPATPPSQPVAPPPSAFAAAVVAAPGTSGDLASVGVVDAPAAPSPNAGMKVHLIDVGQGAATLVELSCGAVLIDTGGESGGGFESGPALTKYLDTFFARRADLNKTLDLVVLTHPHLDHTRNAQLVAERYTVKNVVTDGRNLGSGAKEQKWLEEWAKAHAHLETIDAANVPSGGLTDGVIDPVACKDVNPTIKVLWGSSASRPEGWSAKAFENDNNQSVVVRVDVGDASLLVMGDLEKEGIAALLEKHRGSDALDADVLEVGHHGSDNGTTKKLLDAVSPTFALIAVGPFDRAGEWSALEFGHPRRSTVTLLSAATSITRDPVVVHVGTAKKTFETFELSKAIYATGWDGDIVVSATSDSDYRVRSSK